MKNLVLKIDSKEEWSIATKHTYKAIIKKFCKWLTYGDEYKNIQEEVYRICREPQKPKVNKNKVVALIKWVDGTVLDSVFQVVSK